jgi:hypothetical protein
MLISRERTERSVVNKGVVSFETTKTNPNSSLKSVNQARKTWPKQPNQSHPGETTDNGQRTTDNRPQTTVANDVLAPKRQASKDLTPGVDDEKGNNSIHIRQNNCPSPRCRFFN